MGQGRAGSWRATTYNISDCLFARHAFLCAVCFCLCPGDVFFPTHVYGIFMGNFLFAPHKRPNAMRRDVCSTKHNATRRKSMCVCLCVCVCMFVCHKCDIYDAGRYVARGQRLTVSSVFCNGKMLLEVNFFPEFPHCWEKLSLWKSRSAALLCSNLYGRQS